MKAKVLGIFFLLEFSIVFSQQVTFQRVYTGANLNVQWEIIQTADKGYLTGNHLTLLKTDSLGKKEWLYEWDAHFYSFDNASDGGYITTGAGLYLPRGHFITTNIKA